MGPFDLLPSRLTCTASRHRGLSHGAEDEHSVFTYLLFFFFFEGGPRFIAALTVFKEKEGWKKKRFAKYDVPLIFSAFFLSFSFFSLRVLCCAEASQSL